MKIVITGGTGFIGRRLQNLLAADRYELRILGRRSPGVLSWDPVAGEPRPEALADADAIIHLAGEPVAQRWTPSVKAAIRDSRVKGTRHLVHALSTMSKRPAVLVCSSAIGIYGSRGDEVLTESSKPGKGFLADVCVEWEREADLAESLGVRVVKLRTGIVLGREGGALKQMIPAFKAFAGGRFGSGKQWMSWIHVDDLAGMIRHTLGQLMEGPVNGTGPNPVMNTEFTEHLASALNRPALFPVPAFAVRTLFGEMSEIVLGSQRVLPNAAQEAGYKFQYPELAAALRSVLSS